MRKERVQRTIFMLLKECNLIGVIVRNLDLIRVQIHISKCASGYVPPGNVIPGSGKLINIVVF